MGDKVTGSVEDARNAHWFSMRIQHFRSMWIRIHEGETGETSSPKKRTSSTEKHTFIGYRYLFFHVIFVHMDPDPDPHSQCRAGSESSSQNQNQNRSESTKI
jgi:hypothetical protein